jgi:uncharacterized protein (DUF433 family)
MKRLEELHDLVSRTSDIVRRFKRGESVGELVTYYASLNATQDDIEDIIRDYMNLPREVKP